MLNSFVCYSYFYNFLNIKLSVLCDYEQVIMFIRFISRIKTVYCLLFAENDTFVYI